MPEVIKNEVKTDTDNNLEKQASSDCVPFKKKKFVLENLSCASCAAKIEQELSGLEGVVFASVDFVTKRLVLEFDISADFGILLDRMEKIVKDIEPEIEIRETVEFSFIQYKDVRFNGKNLLSIFALILFVIALVLKVSADISFFLFLLSYILAGGQVVFKAVRNMFKGDFFDENFLMSIATIGAFILGQPAEGAAVMIFYQIGEFFQELSVGHSRKSIAALMNIRPDFANLKSGDGFEIVSPEKVRVGDIILIKAGERVPLDGVVINGESMVDYSVLTGESVSKKITVDDEILSGAVNISGLLSVRVTKYFSESSVSRILELVQNASESKSVTEKFITKFSRIYTPAVIFIAVLLALIPPLLFSGETFSQWAYRALVFLVISCPCALVLSVPIGFFGGIGKASRNGVLIKGGNFLEALAHIDTVVFDKTGTLTKGVFNVTAINAEKGFPEDSLLKCAAYAEYYSNHPIAKSILSSYHGEIEEDGIKDYQEIPGLGIKVLIKGRPVLIGNAGLMLKYQMDFRRVEFPGTVVYIAVDGKYAGNILISDELKEDSAYTVKKLRELGVRRIVMLTGDNRAVAERIGTLLELDEVYAHLLPEQKVAMFEKFDKEKKSAGKIVFVGDGINDAPVLARADIGVAMGGLGADAAIEASDIVIMTDEPSKLVKAVEIADKTRRVVWQNIVFVLIVKMIFLLLGAFGVATMWEAVFADVGVSLLAVMNVVLFMKTESQSYGK